MTIAQQYWRGAEQAQPLEFSGLDSGMCQAHMVQGDEGKGWQPTPRAYNMLDILAHWFTPHSPSRQDCYPPPPFYQMKTKGSKGPSEGSATVRRLPGKWP